MDEQNREYRYLDLHGRWINVSGTPYGNPRTLYVCSFCGTAWREMDDAVCPKCDMYGNVVSREDTTPSAP